MTNLFVLTGIFLISSLGSRWLMIRMGYGMPHGFKTTQDRLLLIMKLLLMSICALVLLVVLWLAGINPLNL